jgi:hypothetical protein
MTTASIPTGATEPTFPPALPHAPIREIFPDVFVVRGSIGMAPLVTIPRNMMVLREAGALTLVNSVRLTAEGEAELSKLGEVKQLVKLGHFHTRDDPYYLARFRPIYWTPSPSAAPATDARALENGGARPLERARPFRFDRAKHGEAALVVEQPGGNLLITCDSVQNWESTEGCSFVGGLATRFMGLLAPAKLGPIWVKEMTGGDAGRLWPDFERLLQQDFAHLVAGHGTVLRDRARDLLARSCEKALGPRREPS